MIESYSKQVKYKEPLLLFRNEGGKFRNVSAEAGPVFTKAFAARGLAVGDFNNDGKLDVLIANNGGPPALLKNVSSEGNHWIGLRLQGTKSNRDGIGAKIAWSVDSVRRGRLKTHGGSYLSSHDPREVLGLGKAEKADYVEIKWPAPSGLVERFHDLPCDRYSTVIEGKGQRAP